MDSDFSSISISADDINDAPSIDNSAAKNSKEAHVEPSTSGNIGGVRTRRQMAQANNAPVTVTVQISSNDRGKNRRRPTRDGMEVGEIVRETTNSKETHVEPSTSSNIGRVRTRRQMAQANNAPVTVTAQISSNDRGKNRRRPTRDGMEVGEFAARAPVIDTINLVDAVQPSVTGNVTLLSDEEVEEAKPNSDLQKSSTPLVENESFRIENPEIGILVKWGVGTEQLKLRKFQKFSRIIDELATIKGTTSDKIVLNYGNVFIKPDDTPDSINYQPCYHIEGRIMDLQISCLTPPINKSKMITLKVQVKGRKKPLYVTHNKEDRMKLLYIKTAEQLELLYSSFDLSFDGEIVEYDHTVDDLQLVGDEVFDLIHKH